MSRKHRASGGRGEKSQKNTHNGFTRTKKQHNSEKSRTENLPIKGIVEHFGGKHDQIDILEDS